MTLLLASAQQLCRADGFVFAPTMHGFQTNTIYPFLIKWTAQSSAPFFSMRYQQVYNKSLFTNLDSSLIYVTTIELDDDSPSPGPGGVPGTAWTVPEMQINLSTTTNSADSLSPVFSENVGADDTVAFGPGSFHFEIDSDHYLVQFPRPFKYNWKQGNLLMDIRIFNASDPIYPFQTPASLLALNSPADEVSRVWATNVTATSATGTDTMGLETLIQLSPVPSLHAYTYVDSSTNYIAIQWPTEPMGFILQQSEILGTADSWQPVPTSGILSNEVYQLYYFPASSAGPRAFYRLFWSGQ